MENHDGEEILPRPPIAVLDVESDHLQSLIHIQELALLDWDPRPGVIDMEQGLQVVVLCEFSSIFPEHRIHLDSAIATNALRRNIIILQELAGLLSYSPQKLVGGTQRLAEIANSIHDFDTTKQEFKEKQDSFRTENPFE